MTDSKLPGFEQLGTLRPGVTMLFRGCAPDESGAFEGELVEIELTVPALNIANIKRLHANEEARAAADTATPTQAETMELLVTMIERALRQNYRGVPRWLIEQSVDIENMRTIVQEITGQGRGKPQVPAESAATAE